ncbi:MAG: HPr family phosphocarrier protein [Collinsella sp.]
MAAGIPCGTEVEVKCDGADEAEALVRRHRAHQERSWRVVYHMTRREEWECIRESTHPRASVSAPSWSPSIPT